MSVQIVPEQKMADGEIKVKVVSPYSNEFVQIARQMNGVFNRETKAWYFPAEDLDVVRGRVKEIYGVDPLEDEQEETVSVQFDIGESCGNYYYRSFFAMGRDIAYRPGRDSSVRLGEGVTLVAGKFPSSGGSVKNPNINPEPGTVLRVRNVPRSLAEKFIEEENGEIVGEAKSESPLDTAYRLASALSKEDREELIRRLGSGK